MRKAVPAFATGHTHERPVAAALRSSFAAVWIHRMPAAGAPPIIVAPDGAIDLQWIEGSLRVAGPDREPKTEIVPAGAMVIGFRFQPAAAASWLRSPASEMVGLRLALEDLWGAKARRLVSKIRGDGPDLVASLEAALIEYAPIDMAANSVMRAAYTQIEAGPPPGVALVPWLGRSLGISERTLRRRFDESFGYGPKTLDRILRYQRFLRLARTSPLPAAMLAVEAGYADQAHLVRESRRLSGATPRERLRSGLSSETGDTLRR